MSYVFLQESAAKSNERTTIAVFWTPEIRSQTQLVDFTKAIFIERTHSALLEGPGSIS